MTIFAFGFFIFLFYRIMTAAMFDDPMSIIACLLAASVNSAIALFGTGFAAVWALNQRDDKDPQLMVMKAIFGCLVVVALSFAAAWLISLGFSERFYERVSHVRNFRREFYEQDWFWFLVVVAIPTTVHYAITFNTLRKLN